MIFPCHPDLRPCPYSTAAERQCVRPAASEQQNCGTLPSSIGADALRRIQIVTKPILQRPSSGPFWACLYTSITPKKNLHSLGMVNGIIAAQITPRTAAKGADCLP